MISIGHVEIHFEVDGEGDEATFVRLFEKYHARAARLQAEATRREERTAAERRLHGGRRGGGR